MSHKTILVITDGIGDNPSSNFNAFCNANKPTYDWLFENIPNSLIKTYGEFVGLPDGQMGNSEVGHMSIGSGRILYQDLVKVNLEIKNDTLKNNIVLNETIKNSNNTHILGLMSDGGVHAQIEHIIALAKISATKSTGNVILHLITDGRDVSPKSAKKYLNLILEICDEKISIGTISGRYYAMDRDNNWDRIKLTYDVMTNEHITNEKSSPLEYIEKQYEKDILDEFITPARFGTFSGIQNGDGLIIANYRSDRAREISTVFGTQTFKEFPIKNLQINIATLTEYDKNLHLPVMFPKENPINTLSEVISKNGFTQLHTAETEKYAHVTFFFNGGSEDMLQGETRTVIPSPKIATYDLQPEMSAPKVGEVVRDGIEKGEDFIVVNFANGDMVGHTGVYEAGIKAVEAVDYELGLIIKKAKEHDYNIVITSDHGNCEMMRDDEGNTLTNHTIGDVFCFVIAPNVTTIKNGGLNNIAPTVLKLMGLEIPKEMDEPLF